MDLEARVFVAVVALLARVERVLVERVVGGMLVYE
jgi:hypothetical protein